jgi:hypothetical protein
MASSPPDVAGEYEFTDSQNQLIGSLARKMGLVGFVMLFFGVLQMVNGVMTMIMSRNPDRVIAAAEKAGLPADQLDKLREALSGGFWSSPVTMSALAIAIAGLFLFLLGLWTRQSAMGFAGIVLSKGRDVSRLMDALGALHQKYSMIYTIVLVMAIMSLISIVASLWHAWRG